MQINYTYASIKSIKRMAKKNNTIIENDYKQRISLFMKEIVSSEIKIKFSSFFLSGNLGANSSFKNTITLYPRWAYEILINQSERLTNAFRITIGHELTHKEGDLFPLKHGPKFLKVISWINEVHCDFAGAQKMVKCNRDFLVDSCKFKKEKMSSDNEDCSHPSWDKRVKYAESYDFDEKLIRKIISDAGVKPTEYEEEKLVDDVFKKFSRIHLLPTIEKHE